MSGNDIAIIACGRMVERAMQAAEILKGKGVSARVIDMYSIKPIDKDAIIRAAKETKGIVTVEDHNIYGGGRLSLRRSAQKRLPQKSSG